MDPRERPVSEIMQTELAILAPDERLDLADDVMKLGRVRHMPVVEEGRLVGVLSHRDLLASSLTRALDFDAQHRRSFMRSIEVREAMTRELVTVQPQTSLRAAAELLVRRKIGCLLVVEGADTLVGMVTDVDLLRAALISDEPDRPIEVVGKESKMSDLSERMNEDLESLKRARDELRVQMHLAKAETRDLWDRMEKKFEVVESRVKRVGAEAKEPLHDVGVAARDLLHEIREGYKKIRAAL
jgi:CBS domain-containing membrane protein